MYIRKKRSRYLHFLSAYTWYQWFVYIRASISTVDCKRLYVSFWTILTNSHMLTLRVQHTTELETYHLQQSHWHCLVTVNKRSIPNMPRDSLILAIFSIFFDLFFLSNYSKDKLQIFVPFICSLNLSQHSSKKALLSFTHILTKCNSASLSQSK